ncbi:DNA-binding IclR family transcriptional regulator [Lipingzhangella halophila]|uniref:DNA-binding IclR family transcriptional regulator n=1 Tax=Lipingzhangella halophila TaxID=1783352 RepID=A0A7W7W5Y9_9ACTN|nr:IclR family transcriptional regulator [Lipingzhangella halophila]MBB4935248.1 DNA-binding IclR family transcriptional regulator [Lipingzhangella halophila]
MSQERSLAPAVTRAAAILDVLAEERGQTVGLSELARRLGLAKSSVSNICAALVDGGLLQRRSEGFRLGQRLVGYADAYLAGVDIVHEFQEACRAREAALDETVQLAVLNEARLEVVYLARRDGRTPVILASQIGRPLPATTTATGKAILAELADEDVGARLAEQAPLPRMTPQSITEPAALRADLATTRERGYAVDDSETVEGLLCLAMTVPGTFGTGQPAAVSFTGLDTRSSARRLDSRVAELRQLTRDIGTRMGVSAHAR